MTILITGDSGFIGKEVYDFLKKKGFQVYGTSLGYKSGSNSFKVDITEKESLENIPKDIETVIHLAAVRESFGNDSEKMCMKVNAEGTLNVARFAAERKVKHFIYISTNAVYGKKQGKIKEEDEAKPYSYYGKSKCAGELNCKKVSEENEMKLAILRLASVFGRSQKQFLVSYVLGCLKNNKDIIIYGKGEGKWDLLYIKDFLEVIYKVLRDKIEGTYNIGTEKLVSVKKIVKTGIEVFKSSSKIVFEKSREENKDNVLMDTSKAKKDLDLKIKYDIKKAFLDMKNS